MSVHFRINPDFSHYIFGTEFPPSTPFQEAKDLVNIFEQNLISLTSCVAIAKAIVPKLVSSSGVNFFYAMEGLLILLKLDDSSLQQLIVQEAKSIFYSNLLTYPLDTSNYQQLIDLEASLSATIELRIRSDSSQEVLYSLWDLYQSLLEHLWLPLYLQDNGHSIATQYAAQFSMIKNRVAGWHHLAKREIETSQQLKRASNNTLQMLALLADPLPKRMDLFQNEMRYFIAPLCFTCYKLGALGRIYMNVKCYPKALDYHQAALRVAEQANDERALAGFYNNLGLIYQQLEDPEEALKAYSQGLTMARNTKDPEFGLAHYYCKIGDILRCQGRYDEAIVQYREQLKAAVDARDQKEECDAYQRFGATYYAQKDFRLAAENFLAQINLLTEPKALLYAYTNLGESLSLQNKYVEASKSWTQALSIARELDDQDRQIFLLKRLGIIYGTFGEHQESIRYSTEGLVLARTFNRHSEEFVFYILIANSYISLRQIEKAKEGLKAALLLADQVQGMRKKSLLNELGLIEYCSGNYSDALSYYNAALEIRDIPHKVDTVLLISLYNNIGAVYLALGNAKLAKKYVKLSLKKIIESSNFEILDYVCSNLSEAYFYLNKHEKMELVIKQWKNLQNNTCGKKIEAIKKYLEAYLYLNNGEFQNAIDCFKKSVAVSQELEDPINQGRSLYSLAEVYRIQHDMQNALAFFRDYIDLERRVEHLEGIAKGFNGLGFTYLDDRNYTLAEENFRKSIETYNLRKNQFTDRSEWLITFFEKQADSYIGLEITFLEQKKFVSAPDEARALEIRALEASESRRAPALNSAIIQSLELEEDANKSLTILEMQELAKKHKTTFIVYSMAPLKTSKSMLAWIISADSIHACDLPIDSIQAELDNYIETLNAFPFDRSRCMPSGQYSWQLRTPTSQTNFGEDKLHFVRKELRCTLARWYDALIDPLKDYLPREQETLTIVPDGFLSQLPFGLFLDIDDKYLIEKHPISIMPSLKSLYLLDKKQSSSSAEKRVVLGNPDTGDSKDSLPYAEDEAKTLGHLFGLSELQILLGKKATPKCFKEEVNNASSIFLSCHGLANKKSIIRDKDSKDYYSVFEGCLKLAVDPEHPQGILDSKEISELQLKQTEFVCLSACFSGIGGIWQEGSIGLVRSFLAAGASSVMAAYWPVRDNRITVQMVEKMVENMLAPESSRLTRPRALQKIMKDMIAEYPENVEEWGVFFLTGI